jgi:pimeloyl-ACP methyl ester carboxylesterase
LTEWASSATTDGLSLVAGGSGPEVVLVHGGVGPELTWERQHSLAAGWRLLIPTRRGFSHTGGERQDFDRDAYDLSPYLNEAAHLVGFSYGGLGSAILAGQDPRRVKSLTLIETPLYLVAPDDPGVEDVARSGDAFLDGSADAQTEREFLANAGIDPEAADEHSEQIQRAIDAARGGRSPREASPDLDAILGAGIPVMVISGDHHPGIETVCDALAVRLDAKREIVPGAGHAVPRAPGFNDVLEEFLRGIEAKR